jgi:ssDNA-binding Zn-finger/Zn-ribbon topoisomerase 1
MGYELTPTDLQEMLHGEKVTFSEKTLTWKKDGKETVLRGRLLLNEQYKVRIAPKLKSKQPTDEVCPKCKTGNLQLITAIDDSKWYGCTGYPQCRFARAFVPHTFKAALPKNSSGKKKTGEDGAGTKEAQNCNTSSGRSQSATLGIRKTSAPEKQSTESEKPDTPADNHLESVACPESSAEAAPKDRQSDSVQKTAGSQTVIQEATDPNRMQVSEPDAYQRIPKFILRMLKLPGEPTLKPPGGSSPSK